jgi:hypothetical protein
MYEFARALVNRAEVRVRLLALAALAVALSGCGGGSSGPSSNTTSVAVTMSNALKVGQTEQATAAATLTGGTTQSITTGFKSDVPAVATVTDGGLVTAVANGLANIYIVSGGKQGTKNLKVVPDLEGTWQGSYIITGCTGTGFFNDPFKFCEGFSPGRALQITVSISQSMDSTTQSIMLGGLAVNSATAVIGPDGSTSVTSTVITETPEIGIQVTLRLNSSSPSIATGTLSQTWTALGLAGTGQFDANLVSLTRISSRTQSASPSGTRAAPRSLADAVRLMQ